MKITADYSENLFYIYLNEAKMSVIDTIISEQCFILIDENNSWIGIEYEYHNQQQCIDTIYWKKNYQQVKKLKQEMNIDFTNEGIFGIEIILWNDNKSIKFDEIKKISTVPTHKPT